MTSWAATGHCSECVRLVRVTAAGNTVRHFDPFRPRGRGVPCPGSFKPPKASESVGRVG